MNKKLTRGLLAGLILCAVVIACIFTFSKCAEEPTAPDEPKNTRYTINPDGKSCTITKIGADTTPIFEVPGSIDGYLVTGIGDHAFSGCTEITKLTIPGGITFIGDYAFQYCTNLESITFGRNSNLTEIGRYAFSDCYRLKGITIPAKVTLIGEHVFELCTGLESLRVASENTVYQASQNCLIEKESKTLIAGCVKTVALPEPNQKDEKDQKTERSLGKLTIPDDGSVEKIASRAFFSDKALDITIPDSVTHIDSEAFSGCTDIIGISVGEGNTAYRVSGNCLIETASKTLVLGCKSSVIPADGSVTAIGDFAFYYCNELKSIVIPDSVTSIGTKAFYPCNKLETVTLGKGLKTIGDSAFSGCGTLRSITLPSTLETIGKNTFSNCTSLVSITFQGTTAQWDAVAKNVGWNLEIPANKVYCSNGTVALK